LTVRPGAFVIKHYGGNLADVDALKPVDVPLHAAVAQSAPTLIVTYRKGSRPYAAESGPLSTMATRDQHAVVGATVDIEDCHFRMLQP
jgi:DNA (cytosine-5)-methyltransferase 1